MTKKRRPDRPLPNLCRQVIQAARQASVPIEDLDRAAILGQIAVFLVSDRRIGQKIAFKGGAIMHLVDKSPRLSRDLDSAVIRTGQPIRREWVEEAFTTSEARRVVLRIDPMGSCGKDGFGVPIIECHSLSGAGKVPVSLSFNWDEPLMMAPEWRDIPLPHSQTARIPTVAPPERAAEKLRAFLTTTRGKKALNDAYDLYYYDAHVLTSTDWWSLPSIVEGKLNSPGCLIPMGTDLPSLFDEQVTRVAGEWETALGVVAVEPLPAWSTLGAHVRRFRGVLPPWKRQEPR